MAIQVIGSCFAISAFFEMLIAIILCIIAVIASLLAATEMQYLAVYFGEICLQIAIIKACIATIILYTVDPNQ